MAVLLHMRPCCQVSWRAGDPWPLGKTSPYGQVRAGACDVRFHIIPDRSQQNELARFSICVLLRTGTTAIATAPQELSTRNAPSSFRHPTGSEKHLFHSNREKQQAKGCVTYRSRAPPPLLVPVTQFEDFLLHSWKSSYWRVVKVNSHTSTGPVIYNNFFSPV